MNVAEYGGGLQRIGLENMMELARIEAARRRMDIEQQDMESEAKGRAIGEMVGTVGGMGKGFYEHRKAQHDSKNAADLEKWRDDRQTQKLENMVNRRPIDENLKARPTLTDYSAWDDLTNGLKELGWMD